MKTQSGKIFGIQKKSKPLSLGGERCFATSFFLAQKLSNKLLPLGDGKTKKFLIVIILVISINFVYAHGEETFAQAENIIKEKISCNKLTDYQLEILGDYFMEQMHPGELHEIMDERMGGESSESLRQVHINMGQVFYCGEHGISSGNMMNVMMGREMMGYYRYNNNYDQSYYWIFLIIIIIFLILLIVLLIKQLQRPRRR